MKVEYILIIVLAAAGVSMLANFNIRVFEEGQSYASNYSDMVRSLRTAVTNR